MNLKKANALGLTVAPTLVAIDEEVIGGLFPTTHMAVPAHHPVPAVLGIATVKGLGSIPILLELNGGPHLVPCSDRWPADRIATMRLDPDQDVRARISLSLRLGCAVKGTTSAITAMHTARRRMP